MTKDKKQWEQISEFTIEIKRFADKGVIGLYCVGWFDLERARSYQAEAKRWKRDYDPYFQDLEKGVKDGKQK